jgi:PAP2 superfamily protein
MLATAALVLALSSPQASSVDPPVTTVAEQNQPPEQPAAESQNAEPQTPLHDQHQTDDQTAADKKPPTPPHTGIRALVSNLVEDVKHLPTMQNLMLAGIGGGLAGAAHAADQSFNVRLRSHYDAVNTAFVAGKYIGNTPEQVALSLGVYAFGRIGDQPKTSHLGMDLVQAQILCELLVEPIKVATQRERPDNSNRLSFPSGHAAVTFATATVIERHLGWKKSVLGYTIASYVSASRLHDNRHYLSDVVFGAALGSIAGRTVVHHASDYWAIVPAAIRGGGAILVTLNR